MKQLLALLSGLLFGAGLVVSQMTSPAKVQGFLDITGNWDPSLMLVMAGAVGVHFILFRKISKTRRPIFAETFQIPKRTDLDWRLITGAALFGIGWGLGGVCPGPGIVDAASGSVYALVFMAAMALGVFAERRFLRKKA
ncbi:MAG: YeeE/YedE family protein [Polyangiaceae bacterium]|nr:YeeE/YedE family protein [Polyangiaceae bacterium]